MGPAVAAGHAESSWLGLGACAAELSTADRLSICMPLQAWPGDALLKHTLMLRSDRDPDAEQDASSACRAAPEPGEAAAPVLAPRLPALWLRVSV